MTHPTGDALAAEERVVEAVARALHDDWYESSPQELLDENWPEMQDTFMQSARAAIEAYTKAMREGE